MFSVNSDLSLQYRQLDKQLLLLLETGSNFQNFTIEEDA